MKQHDRGGSSPVRNGDLRARSRLLRARRVFTPLPQHPEDEGEGVGEGGGGGEDGGGGGRVWRGEGAHSNAVTSL